MDLAPRRHAVSTHAIHSNYIFIRWEQLLIHLEHDILSVHENRVNIERFASLIRTFFFVHVCVGLSKPIRTRCDGNCSRPITFHPLLFHFFYSFISFHYISIVAGTGNTVVSLTPMKYKCVDDNDQTTNELSQIKKNWVCHPSAICNIACEVDGCERPDGVQGRSSGDSVIPSFGLSRCRSVIVSVWVWAAVA